MPRAIAILTTSLPKNAAAGIAETLVGERLAACAQVTPIESCYRWNGAMERADESRLEAKTAPARLQTLAARVAALHPYDLPEIIGTEATASDAYADWVEAETRG